MPGEHQGVRAFEIEDNELVISVPGLEIATDWSRLAGTRSCVDLVFDLVAQDGLGRLAPFWPGPTDPDVIAQSDAVADPDGGTKDEYLLRFASLIGESAG